MKTIFYLKTCSTCTRILKTLPLSNFTKKEIKIELITETELTNLVKLSGSYESLFSRKAKNYTTLKLKEKILSEDDYKKLILQDYTFLKRPVIVDNNKIFIGNERDNLAELNIHFNV